MSGELNFLSLEIWKSKLLYVLIDHIVYIAPSQPPDHFSVTVLSSTSVTLTWSLPPINSRNGIIRGFEVYYKNTSSNRNKTQDLPGNGTLHHVLDQLGKYTTYTFKVLAYTLTNKKGPYSNSIEKTTKQDGMTFCIILLFFVNQSVEVVIGF
jgi:hypothetical protein